jgi:signal transduction histidine kinase
MRWRLILSFIFIALVSIVSVILLARRGVANEVYAYMFRGGMTGSEALVDALEAYYRDNQTWQGAESILLSSGHGMGRSGGNQGMMQAMMGQRVRLANMQGQVLMDSADPDSAGSLNAEEIDNAIPLRNGQEVVGFLLTEGGMRFNQSDQTALLNRLSRAGLIAALVAVGISTALALFLSYRLLVPVHALTQAAGRLAQGDLTQRVQAKGNDELAQLGQAFNHMAASLQQSEENRRAMTADIAHELRTPLAVQRAHLEALQDGIYLPTPENLALVLDQNLLLTRLVDDLRTLALAESGQLSLDFQPVDLIATIQGSIDQFAPQADARQVKIQLDSPGQCPKIMADPARLIQIFGNILSNALRYTPNAGSIELAIACQAEKVRIIIHDSGSGIPEESLPHIFERFYRGDRSRSRSEGGSGLGLAIARQLAQAHGGELTAANHPLNGAVFTLTLPYTQSKGFE